MKTYLFDFDGTLVDSMPTFAEVMLRILDENGVKYPEDIIKIITPLGNRGAAEYYIKLGLKMTVDEAMEKMREYFVEAYTYHIPAKEHVIETLKALRARGDDLNVLTASPHTSLDPCLKRLGIYDMFSNVWACDSDFGTTKTDPEIYKTAAERMGVTVDKVIFIDDNLYADIAGKESGAVVYGIYDDSSAEFVDEIKAVTDRYIYDFAELLND
ncbi:MAG: HAD family phosphatase [Clostridia bacterium]|nr:HAD family phosphatase [Clostridia bacterium]